MTEPKKRPSADKTRQNILKAAQYLFAKHGFDGTSISMLAKRAKINQSLIYHHFENKETLWIAVKTHLLAQTFSHNEIDALNEISDAKTFICNYMETRFTFYKQNPHALRIMTWQTLEAKNDELSLLNKQAFGLKVRNKIEDFQKTGQIRDDVSAAVVSMFIQRSINELFSYTAFVSNDEHDLEQYLQQTIMVVLDGVLADKVEKIN